ncbi:MAG: DUF4157 domain-containing protein [Candidatus Cybelea sp.]
MKSALLSPGQPLDVSYRAFFEPQFGRDFSQVRVHTDGEAAQANRKLGAQGFTYRSHIFYSAGNAPDKNRLTGHELAHVAQQGSAPSLGAENQAAPSAAIGPHLGTAHRTIQRLPGDNIEPPGISSTIGRAMIQRDEDPADAGLPAGAPEPGPAASTPDQASTQSSTGATSPALDKLHTDLPSGDIATVSADWNGLTPEEQDRARQDEAIWGTLTALVASKFRESLTALPQVAAEWLNGYNREDILARLKGLAPAEVASLHQGAIDNRRVGPKAQLALLTDHWVTNPPAADPVGEQKFSQTTLEKGQIYDAITRVAPSLSHELRVMLVGHSWLEQQGKSIINYNFAGVEGGSASFVYAWISWKVSRAEYDKNPSAYKDWTVGGFGTIQEQIDRGETSLFVVMRAKRPAYASLDSAAAAFVHNIESKFHKLQASPDPHHQELVQAALGGDAEAYAQIVTLSVPALGIFPFNPNANYADKVIDQIDLARTDLAARAPSPTSP